MKSIAKIFMLGLLLFPMCAFAQKATEQREYEIQVDWEDMQGYSERVSYKVPIYYDEDDNVVKHGPLRINHKHNLSSRVGQKCIIAYTVSGNYVNGKLDGVLSVEKSVTISAGVLKVKGTLNFVNGVPNGTWTFAESANMRGRTETTKLVMIIKDAKIVSFNINNGEECFTMNSDNTFSGKLRGDVYKNSLNTSTFIRKTGEMTKPDETAKNLINAYVAGTMSESDLIAKGFAFNSDWWWIARYDWDNPLYYISKLCVGNFTCEGAASPSPSSLIYQTKDKRPTIPASTLVRVKVKSTEEIILVANTIKTSVSVSERSDGITWWSENRDKFYHYTYGLNQITTPEGNFYFTDEAKLKLEEVIKAALEERRLEQERLAEEKRLQELERQKMQIQQVCDYLVAQRTAFSISYGGQIDRYFDPTGLEAYWPLDLNKAIKPFCKIVACKIVDFEIQEDKKVAVLDITKYNKKGNITYRVPVTIVNGKILVTSINFSNATVVE